MDRISDSGSDGCGSIPHGGTRKAPQHMPRSLSCTGFSALIRSAMLMPGECPLLLPAPLIQPTEIFPVPEKCILWLEYPVVLVREDKQS